MSKNTRLVKYGKIYLNNDCVSIYDIERYSLTSKEGHDVLSDMGW